MIHFGVIHATYRERHTMPDTVASLHAAGVEYVTLFPDGGVYGALRNMDKALHRLIAIAGPRDHVCVVDDDLVVCKDALIALCPSLGELAHTPHTLYTVAHSIRHLPEDVKAGTGWVELEPNWNDTWGGMVILPRWIAELIVRHPFWVQMKQTDKEGKKCDVALYETLRLLGHKVMAHIPSLTKDIGQGISTIGNEHTPDTQGYRYEEWDKPEDSPNEG